MPFLRRRGVMASENDMRRHTVLDPESGTNSGPSSFRMKQPAPRKSLANDFLDPSAANTYNRPSVDGPGEEFANGAGVGREGGSGNGINNGENSSFESNMPSLSTSMSIGRPSEDPYDRPESPPIQEETPKHRRFSMLRFRNASDSQLSVRMRQQQLAERPPPMPQPPAIITTAPTMDSNISQKKSRMKLPIKIRRSGELTRPSQDGQSRPALSKKHRRKSMTGLLEEEAAAGSKQAVSFQDNRPRPYSSKSHPGPVSSDQGNSALTLPGNRLSESERSEASSGEHNGGFGNTIPATQASSTGSSIFRLGRRKQKQPEPLFPMGHLPQRSKTPGLLPTASSSSLTNLSGANASRPSTSHARSTPVASPSHGPSARAPASPATALFRPGSRNSGQSSPTRAHLALRERSSTMSSMGRNSEDHQMPGTTRTSSSTGRKSFGDLLGLSRLRHNPDSSRQGSLTPATPGSITSKNNSLQLPRERESIAMPERREDDTPAKYLNRLEDVLSRGVIASALSKGSDPFSASVLRSYMRTFGFFEEPMDMAIRKLLMEAELPKETQQIDRCLQAFANRYHECNPGIYTSPDQAYFVAFSLLILHTDVFNKNNKFKMQKADYLKNTRGEGIFDDVLECFYDNITYTPFIHVEDDFDINGDPVAGQKAKKKVIFSNGTPETLKRSKDPIDPYTMILDGKLDSLRPPLKDQMPLEEHYNYVGTAKELNVRELQRTFFKTGVLQIVSARSRPDAFMTEKTLSNPQDAEPGIVDIKVTKVGTLWRKDVKKKKTRSPWQEWGAILTGAQLYFFRNAAWVKSLVHQYETHVKSGHDGIPLIFKPPLEQFKPDALMSTDGAVALFDQSYKKHKNAFVYVRHGGFEEVLLANDEDDRNDWLAKLNYAAAFRTSGVRMRGVVGGNYEGQNRRAIRRLDSSEVTQVIQTPTGEVSINRSRIDHQMAHDILAARRFMMNERIMEGEDKLQTAEKHLDSQLRNARHLLLLAPIQEKTRDQVRASAAKVIAQLRWSRTEIWRLKCHRDILLLDLEEDKELNGDLEGQQAEPAATADLTATDRPVLNHKESKASSHKTTQQSPCSPAPLSLARSSGSVLQNDADSPLAEVFQTPPTSATHPTFQKPQGQLETSTSTLDGANHRKASVSSAASSSLPGLMSPPRHVSSPASGQDRNHEGGHDEEDANERQILEQAGLLDMEHSRASDRPSSPKTEDTPERQKRASASATDRDRADRSKLRRSLQRTLRESTGHLSHHRSRKGKDSASSGAMSDDTVRDDVLSRGTGSFTVHGKKASVINFGADLQGISSNEHLRQRKQPPSEDPMNSPTSADDDFHSILGEPSLARERRESAASASTATARSFRELHRKFSSAQNTYRSVHGGLAVPSDDDSDAALSFSDGRRTPLPPVEDGSGDEDDLAARRAQAQSKQSHYFTPEPPSSPVEEVSDEDEGGDTTHQSNERLSPPLQVVSA
ncbi:Sec7 domain-containing protein [Seiridium cupressi]